MNQMASIYISDKGRYAQCTQESARWATNKSVVCLLQQSKIKSSQARHGGAHLQSQLVGVNKRIWHL